MSDPVLAVAGFFRCGSSMLMRALDHGGIPILPDHTEGAYEHPDLLRRELTRIHEIAAGHAFKFLDPLPFTERYGPLPTADFRFVWLDRDATQQAKSAVKMLHTLVG
ncbi:MAG TPA: hypothetical protein VIG24_10195, partial [Acidimicrobiia bacterium]